MKDLRLPVELPEKYEYDYQDKDKARARDAPPLHINNRTLLSDDGEGAPEKVHQGHAEADLARS